MRYLLPTLVLTAALSTPSAGAFAAGLWPVEIFDVLDDQRLVLFLRDEDIAAGPAWHPGEGGPPLTIAAALDRIHDWIAKDPRLTGAEVHEIELKPIHAHEKEHRWYYLVQLRAATGGKRSASYAAVLFNGKVIPVIAEPASIK